MTVVKQKATTETENTSNSILITYLLKQAITIVLSLGCAVFYLTYFGILPVKMTMEAYFCDNMPWAVSEWVNPQSGEVVRSERLTGACVADGYGAMVLLFWFNIAQLIVVSICCIYAVFSVFWKLKRGRENGIFDKLD